MEKLHDSSWEEVFASWKAREGSDPAWQKVAIEVKGWPDWESWRRNSAEMLKADKRSWTIYRFDNPLKEIPEMLAGPYTGWQSRHPQTNSFSFADLLEVPEQYEFWRNHAKIKDLLASFPAATEFIGLIRRDIGKVVCLEGHHRAVAVALAAREGLPLDFGSELPRIALAELPVEEAVLLEQALRRGSAREEKSKAD